MDSVPFTVNVETASEALVLFSQFCIQCAAFNIYAVTVDNMTEALHPNMNIHGYADDKASNISCKITIEEQYWKH